MKKNIILKFILTFGMLYAIIASNLISTSSVPISPSIPTIHIQTIEGPIDYLC